MLNAKLKRSALSLILAVLLVFSAFSVTAFAEDEAADGADVAVGETEVDTTASADDAADDSADVADDTADVADDTADAADDTADAADDEAEHDHEHEDETTGETGTTEKKKEGMSTFDIVSLAILGALIIVGVIYCLKNKEKVGKFLRSLKSEFKKISWSSWRDVRKNTLVVIVVVVAVAVLIGVVDFLFSKGIISLDQLIG